MIIKEIELNNFRIYKGVNKIDLTPNGERNIIIVSGNNGFGKTTFLMSLVWCLYGRQMGNVDDFTVKKLMKRAAIADTLEIVLISKPVKKVKLVSLSPLHLLMLKSRMSLVLI